MKGRNSKRRSGARGKGSWGGGSRKSAGAVRASSASARKKNELRQERAEEERDPTKASAKTPSLPVAIPAAPVEERSSGQDSFPIVGIGASAGGLEALEQFLRRVPERSGMAFVVVQHMDPTHKGAMVDLERLLAEVRVERPIPTRDGQ